jgi:hypothetical protein
VPPGGALQRGRLYHLVVHHDEWCRIFNKDNGGLADCDCDPVVEVRAEPVRQ